LGGDYQFGALGIDDKATTQILAYIKTRDAVTSSSLPFMIEPFDYIGEVI